MFLPIYVDIFLGPRKLDSKEVSGQQTWAKGADFRSLLGERRRHGRRPVFILEIIGPRSHIGSIAVAVLTGHVRHGQHTSPSCTGKL